jgi:hypothetical protein
MNAGGDEREVRTTANDDDVSHSEEGIAVVADRHYTPNSSPRRAGEVDPSRDGDTFYPGYSPVFLCSGRDHVHDDGDDDDDDDDAGRYFVEGDAVAHGRDDRGGYYPDDPPDEFAAASNASESSTTLGQHENCMASTEEGLLFEDSSYGDEIARWMEDHRRFQRQDSLGHAAAQVQGGGGMRDEEDCAMLIMPSDEVPLRGGEGRIVRSGSSSEEVQLKRPASQLSSSVISSDKLSTKRGRQQRSQAHSEQSNTPDNRSSSRRRMDEALHERSRSQSALRDALVALENAKAVVRGCRSRYDNARDLVESTAREECESLLREDTAWNDMFRKLRVYKEETGDCNVKQNALRDGAGDGKLPPEMIRRLSAWVGKNRKEHKRGGGCKTSRTIAVGNASDESDNEVNGGMPPTFVGPDESGDDVPCGDEFYPDSIHADPYKRVALDSIGFDWDPRNSRWNNMYEELRLYKDEHGTWALFRARAKLRNIGQILPHLDRDEPLTYYFPLR